MQIKFYHFNFAIMKRIYAILIFTILTYKVSASQNVTDTLNAIRTENEVTCFKLYPTFNMWTFLKLDTRNGRIWQVQWNLEESKRFETELSTTSQVWKDEEINGRFVLYPTTNNYNFILLDQINGKTYQVQWSLDTDKRFVVPIPPGVQY